MFTPSTTQPGPSPLQTNRPQDNRLQNNRLQDNQQMLSRVALGLVALETLLVTLALIPPAVWTRLLPQSPNAALNGPFPAAIAPLITALIYFLPALIGFLCRSWQKALFYATMPAWIGLGIFVIAATFKWGAFYLVSADHVTANVSVLELFVGLGGMGWLGRHIFKMR